MSIILPDMPTEDNWDSYGGIPITEAAKNMAGNIHFIPKSDGGILIDLNMEEVLIDIDENGLITCVCWDRK